MTTILVPLDGSAVSEQVLPIVRRLAPVFDARVRLLRVVPDLDAELVCATESIAQTLGNAPTPGLERIRSIQHLLGEQGAAYLAGYLSEFRHASIPAESEVRIGDPAATILAVAAHAQAGLIALGTHGHRGLRRWAVGSVSDTIVQAARSPVLLVHGASDSSLNDHAIQRILVPMDGSEASQHALTLACDLAQQAGAQLVLVTAVQAHSPSLVWLDFRQETLLSRLHAAAAARLDAIADTLRHESISVRTIVETGTVAEVLAQTSIREQVDLIVMATYRSREPHHWATKRMADHLLHTTMVPLILVPAAPVISTGASVVSLQAAHVAPVGYGLQDSANVADILIQSSIPANSR